MNLVKVLFLFVCFGDIYVVTQQEFQAHRLAQQTTQAVQGARSLFSWLEPGRCMGSGLV